MKLSDYEQRQLDELRRWQQQEPGWGTRLLARPGGKAAQAVQALVPVSALRAALEGAAGAALKLSDDAAVLKAAGVESPLALRESPLELCDELARRERKRGMIMAGAGGAAFGLAGIAGLVADVPALLTLALRTVHRTALCYGEEADATQRKARAIGIFALASANSLAEKQLALTALQSQSDLLDIAWREGVERVAEREIAKEAAVFSLQTLAARIGLHLGKRKIAGGVPVLGALVGLSVNAWYIRDVAQVARYVFQERWLLARQAPAPAPRKRAALPKKS